MSLNWKRTISVGFSVFALFIGSVGLTGCDIAGEAEQEGVEAGEKGQHIFRTTRRTPRS